MQILTIPIVCGSNMHIHAKFCRDRMKGCRDLVNFQFPIWRSSAILNFSNMQIFTFRTVCNDNLHVYAKFPYPSLSPDRGKPLRILSSNLADNEVRHRIGLHFSENCMIVTSAVLRNEDILLSQILTASSDAHVTVFGFKNVRTTNLRTEVVFNE